MTEVHLAADDFQIGDLVHTASGLVEIRHMSRGDGGELLVNPGDADQLDGMVWQHATVTRNA